MATSNSIRPSTPAKTVRASASAKKKEQKVNAPALPLTQPDKAMAKEELAPKVKSKLVRDSFTIPKAEYQVLDLLKLRAINLKRPTKKGELLRAGIALLNGLSDSAFLAALHEIPSLRTGRPKATD